MKGLSALSVGFGLLACLGSLQAQVPPAPPAEGEAGTPYVATQTLPSETNCYAPAPAYGNPAPVYGSSVQGFPTDEPVCCYECEPEHRCRCWCPCLSWHCACWVTTGDMYPHFPYYPEYHGYYYFRPYNYETVLQHMSTITMLGGSPKSPYSTEMFAAIYATNENTEYPGNMHQGIIQPLPRVTVPLPDLEHIVDENAEN